MATFVQLADGSSNSAFFTLVIPTDYTVTSLKLIWSTPATSKVAVFNVTIEEGGELEAADERSTGGTNFNVTSATTASDLNHTELVNKGGVYLSEIRQTNLWNITVTRVGGDASDALADVANIYGIIVRYK